MHKWFKTLMLVAIGTSAPYLSAYHSDATADLIIGYRQDNSRWSFKAPIEEPCRLKITNSLDEIHIFELGLKASTIIDCSFYFRGHAKWGWVLDGDFRHKIRYFDAVEAVTPVTPTDRASLISTSRVDSLLDGRYTVDLALGVGYPFYFCDCTVKFIPVIGYGYQEQNYRIDQNEKLLFEPLSPLTPPTPANQSAVAKERDAMLSHELVIVDNTNSDTKFVSRWWGPWIGIDMEYNPYLCWSLYGQFEWHFAQFKGKVQAQTGIDEWDRLDRSTHDANGFVLRVGANYEYGNCWLLGVYAFYEDWDANKRARVRCDVDQCIECDGDFVALEPGQKFRFKNKHHGYGVGVSIGTRF